MSHHADFDEGASTRIYTAPYSSHHPVPTIQGYQDKQQDRTKENADVVQDECAPVAPVREEGGLESAKGRLLHHNGRVDDRSMSHQPYSSHNRNCTENQSRADWQGDTSSASFQPKSPHLASEDGNGTFTDNTSQAMPTGSDSRQAHKNFKALKRNNEGREVTDPVTHLPVAIHDSTDPELQAVPENKVAPGPGVLSKSSDRGVQDGGGQQVAHSAMEALVEHSYGLSSFLLTSSAFLLIEASLGIMMIWAIRIWVKRKVLAVWEDGIWQAARAREQEGSESSIPESVQWLNSFLASVWPLINPDLFTSLADTLEDVMQASLPKLVRMISVEDLGQGNEALRILGVKWLPTRNAKQDVSTDGRLQRKSQVQEDDRKVQIEGQSDRDPGLHVSDPEREDHGSDPPSNDAEKGGEEHPIAEGMEAEEGDFVNFEVGLSYRAASTGKSMKVKAKNAHLYLIFYLPGGIRIRKLLIWAVNHLETDTGFSCMGGTSGNGRNDEGTSSALSGPSFRSPLYLNAPWSAQGRFILCATDSKGSKYNGFTNSIDAALADYVAPKSLTVDLKDMLVGDDFKKDTCARGVLAIRIRSASGFKEGDQSLGGLKKGSSDAYVAVGWSKFGKPLWSTRIIKDDMEPVWNETTFILVGPEELNAAERLRVQLWDSDRASADDDLGRIEIDLKDLMSNSQSSSQMWHREDGFRALSPSETMPGRLNWSVGYFAKERIQNEQFEKQSLDPDVKSLQQLKDKVARDVGRKMREASNHSETPDEQQKAQELKLRESMGTCKLRSPVAKLHTDNMIASTRPLEHYPSGILSIQIHHISGLQLEKINKSEEDESIPDDTVEGHGDLPSSYCTIILNHRKIFRTRTKPKNSEPFFNAGTERFVRDLRSCSYLVSISVVHLAVQQRYRSCLVIEFRKNRLGLDKTPAFAILWLPDIPDEEEHTSSLSVYGGDKANLKRAASNSECDLGEQIGSITITAKFRRGLSRYHKPLASGNPGVQDVLEVLDTAEDSKEVTASLANNDEWDDGDDTSTSSESEDNPDERYAFGESIKNKLRGESTLGGDDGEGNGKSPLRQLKDYSDHSSQLHKHHRGLMQWKGARTAKWMKTKMTDGKDKIADSLKHHDRNPGIETEV
ncbi:MAG: hypothetical protein Q9203_000750 [Teloschistes exilis]